MPQMVNCTVFKSLHYMMENLSARLAEKMVNFVSPVACCVQIQTCYMYVTDKIIIDDRFKFRFGEFGGRNQPGVFNQPVDLTLNSSEQRLFITDWENDRIHDQVFTLDGIFVSQINNAPDVPFNLFNPNGIFFTQDGHLLVSSKFHILIFKEDGTFVSSITGISNNTVKFKDSIGVTMMNNGKIVVADGLHGTNRLIVS